MFPSKHTFMPASFLFLALTACEEEATPTPTPAEVLISPRATSPLNRPHAHARGGPDPHPRTQH